MVFFFDLDGTLIDVPSGIDTPSKKSILALKQLKENGHQVFISTGRSFSIIPPVLHSLDIDGYIVSSGAEIIYKNELIYQFHLPQALLEKIYQAHNDNKIHYMLEHAQGYKVSTMGGIVEYFCDTFKLNKKVMSTDMEGDFTKACILFEEVPENIEEFNHYYPGFYLNGDHPQAYDYYSDEVNKGTAIQFIKEHLSLNKEDLIAFGDSYNDVEMFEAVEVSVAMGDANAKTKAVAKQVCASVAVDGVYYFLKEHGYI